jgi:tRNA-uridine 2-sulfurtransferase
VVKLDPAARRVVVGPRSALAVSRVPVSGLNWLGVGAGPPAEGADITVRVRSTQEPAPARVIADGAGGATVELLNPQFGVAPGQAAVFYDGSRIVGGGWIQRGDGGSRKTTIPTGEVRAA